MRVVQDMMESIAEQIILVLFSACLYDILDFANCRSKEGKPAHQLVRWRSQISVLSDEILDVKGSKMTRNDIGTPNVGCI